METLRLSIGLNSSYGGRRFAFPPYCADCRIQMTDTLGIGGDYMEAIVFAAQQALLGKPANLPQVTGAKHPCILGAIYRSL